jgi:uncharacterized membrane protein
MRGVEEEAAKVESPESAEPSGTPADNETDPQGDDAAVPESKTSPVRSNESPPSPGAEPAALKARFEPSAAQSREPLVAWLTAAMRSGLILSVVVAALVLFAQFAVRGDWMTGLLRDNALPADKRDTLLKTLIAGAAAGGLIALVMTWFLRRRGHPCATAERIAWFSTPLGLLPFFWALLDKKAWDEGLPILAATALFSVIAEGTLIRSFSAAPAGLIAAARLARAKVPAWLRSHGPTAIVLIACLVFILVMQRFAIVKHRSFETSVFDLGINDNLAYNAMLGEFRAPIFTGNRLDGPSFLSNHAQFGVFLLVPFYAIRPSSEALLVIQVTLVALAAIPLYFFARRRVSPATSACIALVYLAYPALHGAALYEMTFLPTAAVFVLTTAWAIDAGKWIPAALAAICAMLMREDIPIGLCILGLVFALGGKRFTMGAVLAVVSALYFGIVRFYLMDKAGGWQFPNMMYAELLPAGAPGSFGSVLKTLLTNPLFVLKKLLIEQKLVYVMHLLVPLALLPLRRAWLLAALVPGSIMTLTTTNYGPTVSMGFQYVMHWAPYLFLAVPVALAALAAEPAGAVKMRAALIAMILATTAITANFGAFSGDKFRVGFIVYSPSLKLPQRERYRDLLYLIRQIPPDASVAATSRVGPHISNRKEAYLTDDLGLQDGEYLLYWREELGTGKNRPLIVDALKQGTYGLMDISGSFALLKKGYDTSHNGELVRAWQLE